MAALIWRRNVGVWDETVDRSEVERKQRLAFVTSAAGSGASWHGGRVFDLYVVNDHSTLSGLPREPSTTLNYGQRNDNLATISRPPPSELQSAFELPGYLWRWQRHIPGASVLRFHFVLSACLERSYNHTGLSCSAGTGLITHWAWAGLGLNLLTS